MTDPKFKQIETTSSGYGFVLDKTPEPVSYPSSTGPDSLGLMHDSVHVEIGRGRAVKTSRNLVRKVVPAASFVPPSQRVPPWPCKCGAAPGQCSSANQGHYAVHPETWTTQPPIMHTIPPDIFEPTKCAECHVLETECPNEREVEHGTELARLNGELRELREKLFNSERRITEWAVGFVLESHGKEAERWYQDVAAEYLKETLQMDLREKQQRLARLLKHMAGR